MWDWIGKLAELQTTRRPAALVTVVRTKGSTPREPGARMIVLPDGTFFGTIGGGHLEAQALTDARHRLTTGEPGLIEYLLCTRTGQCCGGVVEILVEILNDGPQLYLFGAGHVGQALCRVLAGTPFCVHLIDERPEWLHADRVPDGIARHQSAGSEFIVQAPWSETRTYVAVMTHSHTLDQEIIAAVLAHPARYVGLIGSRNKWFELQLRMRRAGVDAASLQRVQCPIGTPTGGKSPQEIAVGIAAELLTQYYRPSEHSEREGEAPAALPTEGATRAPCNGGSTHATLRYRAVRREILADGAPEGATPVPGEAVARSTA